MNLRLLDEAGEELEEGVVWYDARRPELGDRFLRTVLSVIDRILTNPLIGTPVRSARRVLVHGFPFSVVYRVRGDTLTVIAVAHQRRRPGYWRKR